MGQTLQRRRLCLRHWSGQREQRSLGFVDQLSSFWPRLVTQVALVQDLGFCEIRESALGLGQPVDHIQIAAVGSQQVQVGCACVLEQTTALGRQSGVIQRSPVGLVEVRR